MKASLLHIVSRIFSFIILLVIINFIYVTFFYKNDLANHSDLVEIMDAIPLDADILYVAESSNTAIHPSDSSKKTIAEFIDDELLSLKVADMTKPAAHAGIYKAMLRAIPNKSQIKTVIVTLNLRSFNAQWIHSTLETALQKSLLFIRPYPPAINRLFLSFKDYELKSDSDQVAAYFQKWINDTLVFPYPFPHAHVKAWDSTMALTGVLNADGVKIDTSTDLACHYIKGFGFQIDTLTNPRMNDFNEIIKLAEKRNWNLLFNLLPENIEMAEKLVGKDLVYLMRENRRILVSYFGRKGITVIDNLEALPSQYFIDQDWTTEHYMEFGRKTIAKAVSNALEEFE